MFGLEKPPHRKHSFSTRVLGKWRKMEKICPRGVLPQLKVNFIQKVMTCSSYPQTDEPNYFPEHEIFKLASKSDLDLHRNCECCKV